MYRFDVDYIDEEQGIKHIPCDNGDYVLAEDALALQAKIEELEALNKMHLPNVELLHKILTQRPYPSGAEWQFIEAWADQFIRLNKPSALKQEGE